MPDALQPYVSALADLFYPQYCVGCERRASDLLCRTCFEVLPRIERPVCARCGMPTAFETFVCDECKGVDFGFESARAPLKYTGVGKEIVHALKYRGYTRVVESLATPLMLGVLDATDRFDAVVPVPLHRSRRRRRGFNQAELLARGVAGKINAPVSGTLQVVRRTRDQVELSATERRANVSGAFRAGGRVRGRVLLIDDVFTTGATMSACAETLLRAGAREVHALSLCRTV
ncbi:MAG: ComF family protein [Actinobacteria bacterium]|nr:ComF family protein [Actinomycetota bacterium]